MISPPRDGAAGLIDDLFRALSGADVLMNFERLPASEQERFIDWVNKARDDEAHWRRIDILVLAMKMAPEVAVVAEQRPAPPGAVL